MNINLILLSHVSTDEIPVTGSDTTCVELNLSNSVLFTTESSLHL